MEDIHKFANRIKEEMNKNTFCYIDYDYDDNDDNEYDEDDDDDCISKDNDKNEDSESDDCYESDNDHNDDEDNAKNDQKFDDDINLCIQTLNEYPILASCIGLTLNVPKENINVKIFFHCALPDKMTHSKNDKEEYGMIRQYRKASEREYIIREVVYLMWKFSVDYTFNESNNNFQKEKDLYFDRKFQLMKKDDLKNRPNIFYNMEYDNNITKLDLSDYFWLPISNVLNILEKTIVNRNPEVFNLKPHPSCTVDEAILEIDKSEFWNCLRIIGFEPNECNEIMNDEKKKFFH